MPEILPRHYIYGATIFMFFIVSGIYLLGDIGKTQPQLINDPQFKDFNKTFNYKTELENDINTMKGNLETDPDSSIFGFLQSLMNAAWKSLKNIFSSFTFMSKVWTGLNTFFGVPAFVGDFIALFVTILFVFAIWSAIFQREI